MWSAVATGFATSAGLIIAIGAQNAFVLRQGLRREFVWLVAAVCIAGDTTLIALGVGGFGTMISRNTMLLRILGLAGSLYLGYMSLRAFQRAFHATSLSADGATAVTRRSVMVSVLGFTFLNPHVYIDTVLLLGTIGARFGPHRWFFALGAVAASTVWFLGLSVGARYASRLMSRPAAWKLLDVAVGTVMGIVGISLAVSLLQ